MEMFCIEEDGSEQEDVYDRLKNFKPMKRLKQEILLIYVVLSD